MTIYGHFDTIRDGWWSVGLEENIFFVLTGMEKVMHTAMANITGKAVNSENIHRDRIRRNNSWKRRMKLPIAGIGR